MYINILLDTVLATDVNKYSLASASCQPIWRTKLANWIYFSSCKGLWDCLVLKPITTKHQSVFWLVSQSQRMSAIFVGICRWISLAAASADPVVLATQYSKVIDMYQMSNRHIHTSQNHLAKQQNVRT